MLSTFSVRGNRPTGVSRRSWWGLGATLGVLLVAVSLVAAKPSAPAGRVGSARTSVAAPSPVPPKAATTGMSRRSWWGLGATLGALLVAVSLVAAKPSAPAGRVGSARTSVAAPSAVPKAATTGPSVAIAPVAPVVAAPPKVATTGASVAVAPAAPAGPRIPDDAVLDTLAPDASTLTRSEPTRVHIPAIQVDSELVALGLQPDGSMEVPLGASPAGWYTGAPTPGELGPAILAGHVDYGGSAGVFYRLRDLEPGDTVEVTRQDDTTVVFRVTQVQQHRKDAFPTAAVYGDIDHAGLRLITCGGQFDRRVHSYEDNIVVFAELVIGEDGADGSRR